MVLHKKGKKTLTRVAGRWGALQEVLRGDNQRAEISEDEGQAGLCFPHARSSWKDVAKSVSDNTEQRSAPKAGQNRIMLSLLGSSREVCSQSLLLYSHSPRLLHLCWFWL